MPFDFPANPTLNQSYAFEERTWIYNGVGWQLQSSTGSTGAGVTDGSKGDVIVTNSGAKWSLRFNPVTAGMIF